MLRYLKPLVVVAMLSPIVVLIVRGVTGTMGANPIERITHDTGSMALLSLVFTLSVTPIRRLTGWNGVIRFRRMLGLFAFAYASLHFLTYLVLDHFFDLATIVGDLTKRPYIMAGATGLVLMVPLAITSTTGWIRRLGGRSVAAAASPDVCRGDCRRRALLVAREGRHLGAAPLRDRGGVLLGVRAWYAWRNRRARPR